MWGGPGRTESSCALPLHPDNTAGNTVKAEDLGNERNTAGSSLPLYGQACGPLLPSGKSQTGGHVYRSVRRRTAVRWCRCQALPARTRNDRHLCTLGMGSHVALACGPRQACDFSAFFVRRDHVAVRCPGLGTGGWDGLCWK